MVKYIIMTFDIFYFLIITYYVAPKVIREARDFFFYKRKFREIIFNDLMVRIALYVIIIENYSYMKNTVHNLILSIFTKGGA